jgi:hypothetical protein
VVGVALRGVFGLYRTLPVPPADAETTRQVVAAQVETLFPGQADGVRWVSRRSGSGSALQVFAVLGRSVDRALRPLTEAAATPRLFPEAWALDAWLSRAKHALTPLELCVVAEDGGEGAGHRLLLLHYTAGELSEVEVVDLDTEGPAGPEHLAAAVAEQLGESRLATPVTWIGPSAAEVGTLLQPAGVSQVRPAGEVFGFGESEATLTHGLAAGAAALAAEADPAADLHPAASAAPAKSSGPGAVRWAAAAALLLGALTAMFFVDRHRAESYGQIVEQQGLNAELLADLQRRANVANWLDRSGPTALAILDELSQKTSGFVIDELRYDRSGQLTLSGTQSSAEAVGKLAADLAAMQTLASAQVRSQSLNDNRQVDYTITAEPSDRFFAGFVPPPEPAEGETDDEERQGGRQ